MRHAYTSIDFGSDSIKIVVCELYHNKLNLLAASSYKARGIKNGLVIDPELALESLNGAVADIESMLGFKIKDVIVSVPSYNASFTTIQGMVKVDGVVTEDDITEVLNSAFKSKQIENKEMVAIIPAYFSIDNEEGLKDPKGYETSVLSVKAMMVSVPRKNIYSVASVIENAGLEVVDIMVDGIGDINTFKDKNNVDKSCAIINIGAEKTNVSIYNKTVIVKNSIIGMGGKNIDQEIAYLYKLNPNDAIKLKETFALASSKYASSNDFYEIEDKYGDIRKISQKEISELAESVLQEILVLARKEINLLTKQSVDYIIITGGTSSMVNFDVLIDELLGGTSKVGTIRTPGARSNKYSVALGNIVYFINKLKLKGIDYTMIEDEKLEASLNHKGIANISSDSMLGKVFGYFFND